MAEPSKHTQDDPTPDSPPINIMLTPDEVLRLENATLKVQNAALRLSLLQQELQQAEAIRQQVAASVMLEHGIPERDVQAGTFGIDMASRQIVPQPQAQGVEQVVELEEPHQNGVGKNTALSG